MNLSGALVLITTSFPISGDGSEAAGSFVSDLVEELSTHGPVRVVAPGQISVRDTWRKGIDIFRFAAPNVPLSTLRPWIPSNLAALLRVLRSGEAATRRAVRAGPTAHILALWALPSGHWARRVSRETDVPYSVWTLGSDIWTLGRIPVVRSHLQRVLRDARTCYSDGLKLVEDTRRLGEREVEFLPSTRRIEGKRAAPLKSAPPYRLLFLGRWHPNKGVDILIDALELLSDDDWQRIEVVEICGGGPLEPLVNRGVARLQASGRSVELHGYLDKAAAEEAILRADYMLIPSRIESIPVVFSDAMKLGCPVIVAPVGDLESLVMKHECGTVSSEPSPEAFAECLRRSLMIDRERFVAGIAGAAESFSLGMLATRIRALTCSSRDQA